MVYELHGEEFSGSLLSLTIFWRGIEIGEVKRERQSFRQMMWFLFSLLPPGFRRVRLDTNTLTASLNAILFPLAPEMLHNARAHAIRVRSKIFHHFLFLFFFLELPGVCGGVSTASTKTASSSLLPLGPGVAGVATEPFLLPSPFA